MKRANLTAMTVEQLVARFVEVGEAQDEALLYSEIGKFNRLFDRKTDVSNELKSRTGDQRQALLALSRHPNIQVRLNAAYATLAVAPREARQALEAIAASNNYPQVADARGALRDLDSGFFKPT